MSVWRRTKHWWILLLLTEWVGENKRCVEREKKLFSPSRNQGSLLLSGPSSSSSSLFFWPVFIFSHLSRNFRTETTYRFPKERCFHIRRCNIWHNSSAIKLRKQHTERECEVFCPVCIFSHGKTCEKEGTLKNERRRMMEKSEIWQGFLPTFKHLYHWPNMMEPCLFLLVRSAKRVFLDIANPTSFFFSPSSPLHFLAHS